MRHQHLSAVVFCAAFMLLALTVSAEIPQFIDVQGQATNAEGNPLDGDQTITFRIYGSSSGTDSLWSSGPQTVECTDGLFTFTLGMNPKLPKGLFASGATRWLGITVGSDPELTPRTVFHATAYSFHAEKADTSSHATTAGHAESADTAAYARNYPAVASPWIDDGGIVRLANSDDSVGIGTDDPGVKLQVEGEVTAIMGHTDAPDLAAGVMGLNDGSGYGVMGMSISGRGVFGTTSTGFGGYFYGPRNYFSGHLGIGTEVPDDMLHVYTEGGGDNCYITTQTSGVGAYGEAGLRFQTPTGHWRIFMDDYTHDDVQSGGLIFRSYIGEAMRFTGNTHVGFNTSPSATYQMSVEGALGAIYGNTSSGTALRGNSSSGYGVYVTAPENYFSGNVGIGTGSPSARLHVNGNARVDGTFHADDFETDAIDHTNITDEVGIASAPSDTSPQSMTTSWASYLSREITVPAAGWVLVLGCASVEMFHDVSGSTSFDLAFSDGPTSGPSLNQGAYLSSSVGSGTHMLTVPAQRLFRCDTPGTYTYYMVARQTGDNECWISSEKMDVLFFTTGYSSKDGALVGMEPEFRTNDRDLTVDEMEHRAGEANNNDASVESGQLASILAELAALREEVKQLKENR